MKVPRRIASRRVPPERLSKPRPTAEPPPLDWRNGSCRPMPGIHIPEQTTITATVSPDHHAVRSHARSVAVIVRASMPSCSWLCVHQRHVVGSAPTPALRRWTMRCSAGIASRRFSYQGAAGTGDKLVTSTLVSGSISSPASSSLRTCRCASTIPDRARPRRATTYADGRLRGTSGAMTAYAQTVHGGGLCDRSRRHRLSGRCEHGRW